MSTNSVRTINFILFAVFGLVFVVGCLWVNVTQDDAYITYRYAENFFRGNGLVYNIGERVEGYTSLLWLLLLILFKFVSSTLDYNLISKGLGLLSGLIGIWYFIYKTTEEWQSKFLGLLLISTFVGVYYWAASGLETIAFTVAALFTLHFAYIKDLKKFTILAIITFWLRPEGLLIWGICYFSLFITKTPGIAKYFLWFLGGIFPVFFFRVHYYEALWPNTFYAKVNDLSFNIKFGTNYLLHFFKTAGVYGAILFLPIIGLFKRDFRKRYWLLYVYVFSFLMYIWWVGGDTLKVYRFFVPIVPIIIFLSIKLKESIKPFSVILSIGLIVVYFIGFWLSFSHMKIYRAGEQGMTTAMKIRADAIKRAAGISGSIAASTIGILGYNLIDYTVIDMLGLTDSVIAKHPDTTSFNTTWKENKHNARYVLQRGPDLILFSTSLKPSAPAERELFAHSEFYKMYTLGLFSHGIDGIFMKVNNYNLIADTVYKDKRFIQLFHDGLSTKNFEIHLAKLDSSFSLRPNYLTAALLSAAILRVSSKDALYYSQLSYSLQPNALAHSIIQTLQRETNESDN